jgi:hypothetical protein
MFSLNDAGGVLWGAVDERAQSTLMNQGKLPGVGTLTMNFEDSEEFFL